ncbi:MAG: WcaI family glycosyltransferase [Bacillota bacterium]
MKVSIVSLYFYPELTGIGVYSYDFAKFLVEKGHKVRVFTTFPFYPEWKKRKGYPRRLYYKETISDIQIHRIFTYVPKEPGTIKRIIHELIFSLLLFIKLLLVKKDNLLICVSPPFFSMVICSAISRIRRYPLFIHIQDLQPDAAIELGMIKNKFAINILRRLEKFSYKSAGLVSSIGEDMNNNIRCSKAGREKLLLFRNWVNFREIYEHTNDPLSFRIKHNLTDDFIVLHAGNIGVKQCAGILLKTAEIAQNKNEKIRFVIAGDGVQRKLIEQRAMQMNLKNVLFLDVQPKEDFYNMLISADISLVMLRKEIKEILIPSKLLNILASGSPLIASVNQESEVAKILKELPLEVTVPPENPEALLCKILEYKSGKADLDKLKSSERKMAAGLFDRDLILSSVVSRLETRYGTKEIS